MESTKKERQKKEINYVGIFIWICVGMVAITIIYGFALWYLVEPTESIGRGTFGDMYGALNSLFSGIALAGVIITIIMQMKELELTRNELRKSAEAQDKSQQALNEQLKSMQLTSKIQMLESYIKNLKEEREPIPRGVRESEKEDYIDKDLESRIEIAGDILVGSIEELLYSKEHESFVAPELEACIIFLEEDKVMNDEDGVHRIYNEGPGFTIEEYVISKKSKTISKFVKKGKEYETGEEFILPEFSKSTNTEYQITLFLKGTIIPHTWRQVINCEVIHGKNHIEITPPELVYLYQNR